MAKSIQASMDKWTRNMGQAADAMKAGIAGVTESPNGKAADAADKYQRNVNDAVASGRYAAGNRAVSLADWKQAATDKGVTNMQNGVRAISTKAKRAMQDQMAYAQTVSQQVAGMPSSTDADMDARALKAIQLMRQYKKGG